MKPIPLILDTDMAGDCDDAGALAVVHALCDAGKANLLCVVNDISSQFASGCIDAINQYYGRIVPVGNLKENDLYNHPSYSQKFNRYIAEHYPNRYPRADHTPDAVELLTDTVITASPSTVLCCIGPLRLACRLLQRLGANIIAAHISQLVIMGGQFESMVLPWRDDGISGIYPEYNIAGDVASAKYVIENWPTPIVFASYELGYSVISGRELLEHFNADNPVAMAYKLYGTNGRDSWDLTAVHYAICGEGDCWQLGVSGKVILDDEGRTFFKPCEHGKHRILYSKVSKEKLANVFDELLQKERKTQK